MLNNESNQKEKLLSTSEFVKKELVEHPEILEIVEERKKRKFTRSGTILIAIGLVLIFLGLLLHTGVSSAEGFIVGIGMLVIIIGILRFLIGLIKPIVPDQL